MSLSHEPSQKHTSSYDSFLQHNINKIQPENEQKMDSIKFSLPFVKRIEPKNKIFETLKYGEHHIKALEDSTIEMTDKNEFVADTSTDFNYIPHDANIQVSKLSHLTSGKNKKSSVFSKLKKKSK